MDGEHNAEMAASIMTWRVSLQSTETGSGPFQWWSATVRALSCFNAVWLGFKWPPWIQVPTVDRLTTV